ncbi:MAG: TIGR03013 family PEP-CTERM/XrtA system glycosyltransferase [Rhodocyclaceae bacterium]|nr:MAG: TIGR03013 family PEP-CTERM/XrtA system glycosyltransferase [Rhodocyclaceae bacterium]
MIKIFNHWIRPSTIISIIADFAFILLGMVIAVMWIGSGLPVEGKIVIVFALLLALTMLGINGLLGFYQRIHTQTFFQTRARAVLSLHLSIPVAYFLYLLLPLSSVNKQFLELSVMGAVFGMLTNRLRAYHSPPSQILMSRVLIFGCGEKAKEVAQIITASDRNVEIVGFFPGPTAEESCVPAGEIVDTYPSVVDAARALNINEIIVAVLERRGGVMPLRDLLDCKIYGIRVLDLATHFEQFLGQIRLDSLKASYLIFGDGFRQTFLRSLIKRIFDIVCSIILLVLAAPIMLLTTIAIVVESGFPIFYRQERVGLNNKTFNVIKFRSMRNDAEKDGKPRWATSGDSRVTRVGKIIRKLRIDELPQLFSVLRGHMGLVGPRPERPFFVQQLTQQIPFYAVRHSVKPGVTGWAQVRFHYGASIEDSAQKLQYDLYYVKNHTLFLDLIILFETIGVVLGGKGAQ